MIKKIEHDRENQRNLLKNMELSASLAMVLGVLAGHYFNLKV